jgi:hypothetical protein
MNRAHNPWIVPVHGGLTAMAAKRLTGTRARRCYGAWILAMAAWGSKRRMRGSLPQAALGAGVTELGW